jgi:uncharacterized glyoxalase superfamily protein PhnB
MGLNIYMVVVIVNDMARALDFYRLLGVEVPPDSNEQPTVGIQMGDMTFLLSTRSANAVWDPVRIDPAPGDGYRMLLEFLMDDAPSVDAKYEEMIAHGYRSHAEPYDTGFGMRFAMIHDPDGNTVLLSGEIT